MRRLPTEPHQPVLLRVAGRLVCAVAIVAAAAFSISAFAQTTGVENLGYRLWTFQAEGPVRGTPVRVGDMIVVGASDGAVYALDSRTGALRWQYRAGAPVTASVAFSDDRVVAIDRAGVIHAIDRRSGTALWRVTTGDELPLPWGLEGWDYTSAAPVIDSYGVLVATGDGALRALDLANGEEQWSYQTTGRLRATPTVAAGRVFVGDGAGVFHAVDRVRGELLWSFRTDGAEMAAADFGYDRTQIYSQAALSGTQVIFGSRDAKVYALDAESGEVVWKVDDGTSGWVIGGPTVAGDRVLVTRSSSTRVRALSVQDGTEIWGLQTGGAVYGSAVVVGDSAYVANGAGRLLAYDLADGAERWRYHVGDGVWGTPLVDDGALYVGSDDGHVYAFGQRSEPTPLLAVYWDPELLERGILGNASGDVAILDYFVAAGYQRLDAADLQAFIEERRRDGIASVVVFASDALPEAVSEGGERSPLRQYAESNGRVVWLGRPPGMLLRNDAGDIVGLDRATPGRLMGVDFSPLNTDRYGVFPTDEGRRRGLTSWWIDGPTVAPGPGLKALATDEQGRPIAWERTFDGRTSGFVYLYATRDGGRLDEIRAVAEYGVFRIPVAATSVEQP